MCCFFPRVLLVYYLQGVRTKQLPQQSFGFCARIMNSLPIYSTWADVVCSLYESCFVGSSTLALPLPLGGSFSSREEDACQRWCGHTRGAPFLAISMQRTVQSLLSRQSVEGFLGCSHAVEILDVGFDLSRIVSWLGHHKVWRLTLERVHRRRFLRRLTTA